MDDEFREFKAFIVETTNHGGESWGRRMSVGIRRSAVAAYWRTRDDFAKVVLFSGDRFELEEAYENVRDWLTRADAPVTLDAFRVKR